MTNITDWLTQARDRADAATPGPWDPIDEHDPILRRGDVTTRGHLGERYIIAEHAGYDADFIAAARTDLPAALDAIQAVLDLTDPDFEPAQSDYECSLNRFDVRQAIAAALGVSEP